MPFSASRKTAETDIEVSLEIGGSGAADVATGVELLDELLRTIAMAGSFDLTVRAAGDLETGDHHTVEDVGITLGQAIAASRGGTGSSISPLGECLAVAAVSFGEPCFAGDFSFAGASIAGMSLENFGHFMRSLAYSGRLTLHLSARGGDDRQKVLAMSKALGRALKRAAVDSAGSGKESR